MKRFILEKKFGKKRKVSHSLGTGSVLLRDAQLGQLAIKSKHFFRPTWGTPSARLSTCCQATERGIVFTFQLWMLLRKEFQFPVSLCACDASPVKVCTQVVERNEIIWEFVRGRSSKNSLLNNYFSWAAHNCSSCCREWIFTRNPRLTSTILSFHIL